MTLEESTMLTQKKSLKAPLDDLQEDTWRRSHPFSSDIAKAHDVLLNPYATAGQKEAALTNWLEHHQPCMFGRIAAKAGQIHYCFINDVDLRGPEKALRANIEAERRLWKQRSLLGGAQAAHGFLLVVTSPHLALAAPDRALQRFASRIRDLTGWRIERDEWGNDLAFETLYLRHPTSKQYHKFTFTADFFAAAGDGRWWTDHRIPGGIAFTANSLGHMLRSREWYGAKTEQTKWALHVAMRTIAESQATAHGKGTWLRNLQGSEPFKRSTCPFGGAPPRDDRVKGKDWTTYEGYLHTDHSIREEFFNPDDDGRPARGGRTWLMDFTYIYDTRLADYVKFMAGQLVSEEEVFAELGQPEEWRVGHQ
jgi:hypothetical protein